jgi:hypothetical protein
MSAGVRTTGLMWVRWSACGQRRVCPDIGPVSLCWRPTNIWPGQFKERVAPMHSRLPSRLPGPHDRVRNSIARRKLGRRRLSRAIHQRPPPGAATTPVGVDSSGGRGRAFTLTPRRRSLNRARLHPVGKVSGFPRSAKADEPNAETRPTNGPGYRGGTQSGTHHEQGEPSAFGGRLLDASTDHTPDQSSGQAPRTSPDSSPKRSGRANSAGPHH